MKWKKQLAYNIVKELYTLPIADEAQKQFELQFQKRFPASDVATRSNHVIKFDSKCIPNIN